MKFLPAFNDMFDDLFQDPFNYSSVDSMRTDIVEKDGNYLLLSLIHISYALGYFP